MKNIKKIIFATFLFFLMSEVHAASISISASSNYVTTGSRVTFYIKINNAAAWDLRGEGNGATSGCSLGDEGVGDSGTGENVTKTLSVSCTATNIGQIGFTVTGNVSVATSGNNIEKTNVNTSKIVVVQAPREKDTNNYLKEIKVTGYNLTPEFNKETLEYTVNVPSTVNKVTISATKESTYASLTTPGEVEVNEGANTFEIKVMSETGIERIYKVNINVADENPINIKINNANYTIMKNAKTLETPSTYEAKTIKINDFDIPAFYSETSKLTLVGVKDSKGDKHFAIYNKDKDTYTLYNENKSNQMLLYIKDITEEKEGYTKEKIVINNNSYEVLISNIDNNIILVNAMDIVTGKYNIYQYDKENGSYILYNDKELKSKNEELEKYKQVTLGFGCALGVSVFIILILLLRKPKQKQKKIIEEIKVEKIEPTTLENENKTSKKEKNSKNKKEEKTNKKNLTKDDAIEQVSEAANMIEEYEKTIKLNKKELEKKRKEMEVKEETMYDIFEDDKKKKKKH